MRLILKRDWDVPISSPLEMEEGYFSGRLNELEHLVNEILRKPRGSILISGYRGVGKTSLVYKALHEAKKRDKNMIIVLLNATELEATSEKDTKIIPMNVIRNLIRRLYLATRNIDRLEQDIKRDIESLYSKATASKFELMHHYQKASDFLKILTEERSLLVGGNIESLIFIASWIIAILLQFNNMLPSTFNNIISMFLLFPIPYFILSLRKRLLKKQRETIHLSSEETYFYDNNIGNLVFELEQLHRKISDKGRKLVYVIDEMDKLDGSIVKEMIRYFKNLFTLSKALFIFVGGEELYNIGTQSSDTEKTLYRSKEYTYFSSRYFLSRPLWDDLSKFIDCIVQNKEGLTEDDFERFKRVIAFDAKNDFFDLKQCIKDRISQFDTNGNPVIDIVFTDEDYKKSRLHKAMMVLFEGKYMSRSISKWKENEELLKRLFEHAYFILECYPGKQINDPQGGDVSDALIRDFNGLLYRLGTLNIVSESQQSIKGLPTRIRTYQYTGVINEPPQYLDEPTEYERRYLSEFKIYTKYVLALINTFRVMNGEEEVTEEDFCRNPIRYAQIVDRWGFNVSSIFQQNVEIYKTLTEGEPPYPFKREDIEKRTEIIKKHKNAFFNNLPKVIASIINSLNLHLNLKIQKLQENTSLFSGSATQIRNVFQNSNHFVIFKPDLTRQAIVSYDMLQFLVKIKKVIEEHETTHRIIVVTEEAPLEVKGCHYVKTDLPSNFKTSLYDALTEISKFFEE
ncbi:MAG: hypothetical protein DRZ76_02995 [Candidatus Nealsonbacteria bacterium]|nr:MAG: hypothetical protein DRZ76_02995 [Candidatus Nealsonbacteria bacterium]